MHYEKRKQNKENANEKEFRRTSPRFLRDINQRNSLKIQAANLKCNKTCENGISSSAFHVKMCDCKQIKY